MKSNYLYYLYVWDSTYRYYHFIKLFRQSGSCHAFIKRETLRFSSAERFLTVYKIVRVLPFNDPDSNTSDRKSTEYLYDAKEDIRSFIYPGMEYEETI